MMISEKMAARLNEQVRNEFFAYWSYLAMAFAFEDMGLKIFAKWFYAQATEEQGHAMKIAQYLLDQGATVRLMDLPAPKTDFSSALEIVEAALQHELNVTKQVNEIVDLAVGESDHATRKFIDWKVEEQVEEVSTSQELVHMVKMAAGPGQLFMLEGRLYHMRKLD
jgi:ferritin